MTMHMINGVNTSRTRKRQPKMTKANHAKWSQELTVYNRKLKRSGQQPISLDEYIRVIHGQTPKRKTHDYDNFVDFKPTYSTPRRGSTTDHIPSHVGTGVASCSKPERKEYSGTLIKGIGTMHKSNAVPVIDEQEMKDLASMRR